MKAAATLMVARTSTRTRPGCCQRQAAAATSTGNINIAPALALSARLKRKRPGHRQRTAFAANAVRCRSEEHTSELQSLRHLVCRLLLEKKKTEHKAATPARDRGSPPARSHDHRGD